MRRRYELDLQSLLDLSAPGDEPSDTHAYQLAPLVVVLPDERRHRMHMLYRLLSGTAEQAGTQ